MCAICLLCTATTSHAKQHKLITFDPRHSADCLPNAASCLAAVTRLTEICPDTSLRHLWGVSPQPTDYAVEVCVETSLSFHETLSTLILTRHSVTEEQLTLQLDNELINSITEATVEQVNSKLWHDLHKGRITSSLFGNVYRARNSPTLVNRILDNRQANYSYYIFNQTSHFLFYRQQTMTTWLVTSINKKAVLSQETY